MNPRRSRNPLALVAAACALALSLAAPSASRAGDAAAFTAPPQNWAGEFKMEGAALSFSIVLTPATHGGYTGVISIPFQNVKDLPLESVSIDGRKVRLVVPAPSAGVFEGEMTADARVIAGVMTQGDRTFDFKMDRTLARTASGEPLRPQTPVAPFAFDAQDVFVKNAAAGITLAGTLATPKGPGPFPCAILLSGAGPHDRDETIVGHKPFLVLADALAQRGVATLRMDDRGVGGSSGQLINSTPSDLARDVMAMIDELKKNPRVAPDRIGVLGHSDGAAIGALAAGQSSDVAFMVMIAAPSMTGSELIASQSQRLLAAIGMPSARVSEAVVATRAAHRLVIERGDAESARWELKARVAEAFLAMYPPEQRASVPNVGAQVDDQVNQLLSPWFRAFLTFDPTGAYRSLSCPVLAIYGSMDLQVSPVENAPILEQALAQGAAKDSTVTTFDGLNHLMQPCNTGLPAEYGVIETTIAPVALETICNWIADETQAVRNAKK